eukprot:TRINITY_DN30762_c0_g1_i1.p1 TRINITY_DN30762_c0_g1~~TRINITY_DN30762_c0_g1_i1.p1  ORF type:complete len:1008 (-),score=157.72 TRINITY_DN30762_c0_g1_i1:25-3048(-)
MGSALSNVSQTDDRSVYQEVAKLGQAEDQLPAVEIDSQSSEAGDALVSGIKGSRLCDIQKGFLEKGRWAASVSGKLVVHDAPAAVCDVLSGARGHAESVVQAAATAALRVSSSRKDDALHDKVHSLGEFERLLCEVGQRLGAAAASSIPREEPTLIEQIRCVAERLAIDEKRNAGLFDLFCEHHTLSNFIDALCAPSISARVKVQLLQTLSVVVQNARQDTSFFYVLSGGHLSALCQGELGACAVRDEDLAAWFVTFLKGVALRLDNKSARLCLSVSHDDRPSTFPLFEQVAGFAHHGEELIRASARSALLTLLRLDDCFVAAATAQATRQMLAPSLVSALRDVWAQAGEAQRHGDVANMHRALSHEDDILGYTAEVLALVVPEVKAALAKQLLEGALLPLVWDVEVHWQSQRRSLAMRSGNNGEHNCGACQDARAEDDLVPEKENLHLRRALGLADVDASSHRSVVVAPAFLVLTDGATARGRPSVAIAARAVASCTRSWGSHRCVMESLAAALIAWLPLFGDGLLAADPDAPFVALALTKICCAPAWSGEDGNSCVDLPSNIQRTTRDVVFSLIAALRAEALLSCYGYHAFVAGVLDLTSCQGTRALRKPVLNRALVALREAGAALIAAVLDAGDVRQGSCDEVVANVVGFLEEWSWHSTASAPDLVAICGEAVHLFEGAGGGVDGLGIGVGRASMAARAFFAVLRLCAGLSALGLGRDARGFSAATCPLKVPRSSLGDLSHEKVALRSGLVGGNHLEYAAVLCAGIDGCPKGVVDAVACSAQGFPRLLLLLHPSRVIVVSADSLGTGVEQPAIDGSSSSGIQEGLEARTWAQIPIPIWSLAAVELSDGIAQAAMADAGTSHGSEGVLQVEVPSSLKTTKCSSDCCEAEVGERITDCSPCSLHLSLSRHSVWCGCHVGGTHGCGGRGVASGRGCISAPGTDPAEVESPLVLHFPCRRTAERAWQHLVACREREATRLLDELRAYVDRTVVYIAQAERTCDASRSD